MTSVHNSARLCRCRELEWIDEGLRVAADKRRTRFLRTYPRTVRHHAELASPTLYGLLRGNTKKVLRCLFCVKGRGDGGGGERYGLVVITHYLQMC